MNTRDLEMNFHENDIIFAFSGTITYNMLTTIGTAIKEDLQKHSDSQDVANMYEVIIEMLQNIMNYSAKTDAHNHKSSGTCFVKQDKISKKFTVYAGNIIEAQDENIIRNKLNKINSLDKDGLKAYYKEVRKHGIEVHSNGAGLGLLTIARKADGELKYNISKVDDGLLYFELCVKI